MPLKMKHNLIMYTVLKKAYLALLVLGIFALSACNGKKDKNSSDKKTVIQTSDTLSELIMDTTETNTTPTEEMTLEERMRLDRIHHNKKLYNEALKVHDPYTQLVATMQLMIDDTAKKRPYLDTLASLYAQLGMMQPAIKMADKVLALDPSNRNALEIKAGSSMGMGNSKDAIAVNKKLYRQTSDVKYLFAIAQLQFDAQDLKGLEQTLKDIEKHPNLSKAKLEMQTDQPGKLQNVAADAVLAYLKGLIALSKNELAMAQVQLHNAVRIAPNFVLANRYLEMLTKPKQTP